MIGFVVEVEIERPVDAVFAYVTDLERLSDWQPNLIEATKETDGPMREGTRIRELRRAPFGRRAEALVEVAAYEPGRRFDLRIVEGPLPVDGSLEFEDHNGQTRLLLAVEGRIKGAMRLMEPVISRALKRQFSADYRRLKRNLEAPAR